MIKKEELRIGNLTQQGTIESIGDTLIQVSDTIYELIFIEPIELTEELLININWRGYKQLYFNSLFSMDEVGHIFYRSDYTGVNVKYVHQLQNLYFALTGIELELASNVA
jgi:hypothetical protein